MHRITDNRMAGESPLKDLQIFADMCGQSAAPRVVIGTKIRNDVPPAMPRVVIGTTMWGEVRDETGERREKQLKSSFWKDMLDNGCAVQRFDDSCGSAWNIVGKLPPNPNVVVSNEIIDDQKVLEPRRLVADQQGVTRRLEEQALKQHNGVLVAQLKERKVELERNIGGIAAHLQQSKIPFGIRLKSFFRKDPKYTL